MSRFPAYRPRRMRRRDALRRLVRETHVVAEQLVQPLFVVPGTGVETPVASMPGVVQQSVDRVAEECRRLADTGVTDFVAGEYTGGADGARTRAFLRTLLT